MNALANYLHSRGLSQAEFGRLIGVSAGAIYQFIHGLRPISEKVCVRIEAATDGALSRKALRPDDWHLIWPELAEPTPKEPSHA